MPSPLARRSCSVSAGRVLPVWDSDDREATVAAMTELKGSELGRTKVRIESGPVRVFATAVKDSSPHYAADDAIVPPTFPFSWSYWGTIDGSTKGRAVATLRGPGRIVMH